VQVTFDVMGVGAQGPSAESGDKMQMKKMPSDMKM
jgi:hypothetical protein